MANLLDLLTPDQLRKATADIKARVSQENQIRKLTNEELVRQVLDSPHSDDPLIIEMMHRVDPNWTDE